jgi:hypothetical protein
MLSSSIFSVLISQNEFRQQNYEFILKNTGAGVLFSGKMGLGLTLGAWPIVYYVLQHINDRQPF